MTFGDVNGNWVDDWDGLGIEISDHQLTLEYVQWGRVDLDDVDWLLLRAQMHEVPGVFQTADGVGFAPLVGRDGKGWDLALYDRLFMGGSEFRACLRNLLTLTEPERVLLARIQALHRGVPRAALSDVLPAGEREISSVLERPEPATADDVRSAIFTVPLPLCSAPGSRAAFVQALQQRRIPVRAPWTSVGKDPLARVGGVVDSALRLAVECEREPRLLLPEMKIGYGAQDPVRVVRAVARALGAARSEAVAVIRTELEAAEGAVDRLAAQVGAASPGGIDDIRTMWSRQGLGGTVEERTLAWWAWLADALDGWMAIPEEVFWDGPRDPVPLERILATA